MGSKTQQAIRPRTQPTNRMTYLNELNPSQRAAVECTEGPVMIIAGAGSGKTRVLTFRIAHILQKNVDAFRILALTFTNKAALEMRERISKLVGGTEAKSLAMGTFHAVFARILRIEADRLGYPKDFSIYDTDDAKSLLKSVIKEMGLDDKMYKPNVMYNRISMLKNNLVSAKDYIHDNELIAQDVSAGRPKFGEIFIKYTERCFKAGAMDFDDLLLKTYELFDKNFDILHKYQHRFQYILVDEYQDTNFAQYIVIKMLAAVHQNLCAVGDDAQSIYSFRGATIKNILGFEKDYPELKTFKLEQNYRSTKNIVGAAADIIAQNKQQLPKEIWTDNEQGEKIQVVKVASDSEEGKMVAQSIFETKMNTQAQNLNFAILYRTNAQSRSFEESLRQMNIAYRIYGGLSFYQRKEIKDLIAYLRLTINANDEEALKRIINYPTRGIGQKSIERLIVIADQEQKNLWDIVKNINQYATGTSSKPIESFSLMIQSFVVLSKQKDAYEVAKFIAKHTKIIDELYNDKTVEGMNRYENLQELLNGIKSFVADENQEDKTLGAFLQSISLLTTNIQDDNQTDNNKVSLMTVHAAKGLEFPYVFIVGMEEDLFPSMMATGSRADLEEERRLFYVAMTRAEKRVMISYSTSRFRHGGLYYCEPSRFLQEINPTYINFLGAIKKNNPPRSWNFEAERSTQTIGSTQTKTNHNINNFKPIENFIPDDPKVFKLGMNVEHQRFGIGQITQLDGSGADARATVFFEAAGEKQIILKFAKMRLIN